MQLVKALPRGLRLPDEDLFLESDKLFPDPGEVDEWLMPAFLEIKDVLAYMQCKEQHPAHQPATQALKIALQLIDAVGGCRDVDKFRKELVAGLRNAANAIERRR